MPLAAMPVSKAAGRRPDVVDALLTDALRASRPASLVVFGAGGGIRDLVQAAEAGRTVVADRNVVHTRAASEALADLHGVEVVTSDGSSHLDTALRADAVAVRAPREKQVARQLIHDAFEVLRPGGRLYLAGALRDGMKPYLEYASNHFGGMQPLAMRKGCRVALGERPAVDAPRLEDDPLLDHGYFHRFTVELSGHAVEVHSRPGVFAWDRLDDGTRALAGTLEVAPGDRVLDLGCGSGLIGVVAARLARGIRVTMVDADVVAVEAARRTAAANGVERCESRLDDGASALPDAVFDVVAVNPPFHLDRTTDTRTAERLIEDAHRVLRPGGHLFLVANRFLPYDRAITAAFDHCVTAYEDRSYRVFRAEKRRHA
ncbi:MAG: methyltransferase [Dehalococcoidia bacterium]